MFTFFKASILQKVNKSFNRSRNTLYIDYRLLCIGSDLIKYICYPCFNIIPKSNKCST